MQLHTAQVRGRRIAWNRREVVQHGLNADAVVLDLDEEWRECDRIQAVLAGAGGPIRILAEGGRFNLPSALMEAPGAIRMCLMGHVGEAVRIVTAKEAAPLTVVESGEMAGADPAPEQPDLWATLMEEVRKATEGAKTAAQSATRAEADLRAAAERGDFDGEDGKTPVRGVDYWTEADRKPIEDATDAALTSAGKADAAAEKASVGEASRAASEVERVANEVERVEAESGRKSAEAIRAANESERTETFNANLTSWNSKVDAACKKATDTASKAAQDAKTATDAAIAKTEEAANAAVAKAQTATDNATTAANKAEAAVSKLPLPLGNTLKGEVESTMVSVHDAYPAPLVTTKVMGRSNQTTTKGANLFDVSKVSSATSNGITMSVEDGCIKLSGTNAAAGVNNIEIVAGLGGKGAIFAAGKYTATVEGISQASLIIKLKDNTFASLTKAKPSAVINNKSEQTMTYFLFQIPQGVTVNEKVKVWFEKGDKSLKEPYTGGKPSPSPDYPQEITSLSKAELAVAGKNLADVNESNNVNFTLRKKPLQAGTYTFSCDKGENSGFLFNVKELDDSGIAIREIVTSRTSPCTFTISEPMALFINGWGLNAPYNIGSIQLEAGSTATAYEPTLKPKATVIDLQSNELCSVTEHREWSPNTFRDELVIDSEGNVILIKRVFSAHIDGLEPMSLGATSMFQYFSYAPKTVRPIDESIAIRSNRFGEIGREPWNFYVAGGSNAGLFFTFPLETFANDGELNEWLKSNPIDVNYLGAEAQTIQLGKVELPALPESTSNIWNNGNIPANVYINYLKDVNIAYADLEHQIKQITLALSVMDTPTIIPEI